MPESGGGASRRNAKYGAGRRSNFRDRRFGDGRAARLAAIAPKPPIEAPFPDPLSKP